MRVSVVESGLFVKDVDPDCTHCGGSGEVCSVCWDTGWEVDNGCPTIDWIAPCPKCAGRNRR